MQPEKQTAPPAGSQDGGAVPSLSLGGLNHRLALPASVGKLSSRSARPHLWFPISYRDELEWRSARANWRDLVTLDNELRGIGHQVASRLAAHATFEACFPSVERMALEIGANEKSVRNALEILEQRGWVRRKRASRQASYSYVFGWDPELKAQIETRLITAKHRVASARRARQNTRRQCAITDAFDAPPTGTPLPAPTGTPLPAPTGTPLPVPTGTPLPVILEDETSPDEPVGFSPSVGESLEDIQSTTPHEEMHTMISPVTPKPLTTPEPSSSSKVRLMANHMSDRQASFRAMAKVILEEAAKAEAA